jgi:hypothetical protein
MDAVALCDETGPETRENEGKLELKIVQTTVRKLATFSVICKKPPLSG